MASYRYLSADLKTGEVRDELPFDQVTYGQQLSGAPRFSATIGKRHPKVSGTNRGNLDAARTVVYVERGGIVVGDGIVWDPRVNIGGDTIQASGFGLASYFGRQRIRNTRDYQDVDLGLVAKDLIDWAQGNGSTSYGTTAGPPEGDIGVDTSAIGEVGVSHFRTWPAYERKPITDALGELDAIDDGIDWWMGVEGGGGTFDRVARIWHPRRTRTTDLVYEWGTNVQQYGYAVMGSAAANLVDAVGQGEGEDMRVRTFQDAAALSAYPLLTEVLPTKDVTSLADLAAAAREHGRTHAVPPVIPQVVLRIGEGTRFGMWALGDRVRVRIDDGWVQLDGMYRVVAWEVTVNAEHDEQVTLTLEPS